MATSPPFRDTLYESYVSTHQGEVPESQSQPGLEADLVRRLPSDRRAAILDVGCGQGQLIRLLEGAGYQEVHGIDASPEQIALARQLGTRNVELGDLFPYAADHQGAYDIVLAVDLVEHFDRSQVHILFTTLASMLSPGGTLLLRTPNASSPYSGRLLYGDLTHGVAYTRRSLEQVCLSSGFGKVVAYPVRPSGCGAKQLIRRALWTAIEGILIVPLIIETGQLKGHIVTQNLVALATRDEASAEDRSRI